MFIRDFDIKVTELARKKARSRVLQSGEFAG